MRGKRSRSQPTVDGESEFRELFVVLAWNYMTASGREHVFGVLSHKLPDR